jgi:hypothetical protein
MPRPPSFSLLGSSHTNAIDSTRSLAVRSSARDGVQGGVAAGLGVFGRIGTAKLQ